MSDGDLEVTSFHDALPRMETFRDRKKQQMILCVQVYKQKLTMDFRTDAENPPKHVKSHTGGSRFIRMC